MEGFLLNTVDLVQRVGDIRQSAKETCGSGVFRAGGEILRLFRQQDEIGYIGNLLPYELRRLEPINPNSHSAIKGASMNWRKKTSAILVAAGLMFITATTSPAFVSGDLDDDGTVRLADALVVLRYIVGTQALTLEQKDACNVNGDSVFPPPVIIEPGSSINCDIIDAVLILRKAYGLIA